MLQLPRHTLSARALRWLAKWQGEVDSSGEYPQQIETAKQKFSDKNTTSNLTFREVKKALSQMQGELVRCAYCEDSPFPCR